MDIKKWMKQSRSQLEQIKTSLLKKLPNTQLLINKIDIIFQLDNNDLLNSTDPNHLQLVDSLKQDIKDYIQVIIQVLRIGHTVQKLFNTTHLHISYIYATTIMYYITSYYP